MMAIRVTIFVVAVVVFTLIFVREARSLLREREACRRVYTNSVAGRGRLLYFRAPPSWHRRWGHTYPVIGYYLCEQYYEAEPLDTTHSPPLYKLGQEVNILLSTEDPSKILLADYDFEDGFLALLAMRFVFYLVGCLVVYATCFQL